jgi:hypothetical protein
MDGTAGKKNHQVTPYHDIDISASLFECLNLVRLDLPVA